MTYAKEAYQTIEAISNNIQRHQDARQYGLIGGNAGMTLFNVYMYEMTKDEAYLMLIQQEAEYMIDAFSATDPDYTFAYGLAGIVWLLGEMDRLKIISLEEDLPEYVAGARAAIIESINYDIAIENLDFFAGAIGKVVALLPLKPDEAHIAQSIFDYLERKIGPTSDGLYDIRYNDGMKLNGQRYVNLGLAHGLPAILQFCTLCIANDLCKPRAQQLASMISDFLMATGNGPNAASQYPFYVVKGESCDSTSRLAWCYGDLSLAVVLLQASHLTGNQAGIDHAIRVVEKTIARQSTQEAEVFDACICHGSAGLAHMYNKVWRLTNREDFKVAMDNWMNITLRFARQEDGKVFFDRHDQRTESNAPCFNLIEGSAGIGLVLYSYLFDDSSWDMSFLLN